MTIGPESRTTDDFDFLNLLSAVFSRRNRIYDYTAQVCGSEYAFEVTDCGSKAYMTGQRRGVKQGDSIVIKQGSLPSRYRVEQIEYYASPSDMWVAVLIREP